MEGTLRQRRFRKLLRALYNNGTGLSQDAIAELLDVSQALISSILREEKHAGDETIDKAKRALKLHEDYFSEENLGPYVTHEHFVGRSPLRELTLHRDAQNYEAVVGYFDALREAGRPAHPDDELVVLGIRFADGGASLTPQKVREYHQLERNAREQREIAEARGESVARELRPLPPGGKRVGPLKKR